MSLPREGHPVNPVKLFHPNHLEMRPCTVQTAERKSEKAI